MNLNWGGGYSKSEVDTLLTGKADSSHTHTKSQITDFPSYGTTANSICEGNDSRLSDARTPTAHTHAKSEITDFPTLSTVATSGSYNDLSNKPTIPTVNNATLKIQKNGTDVKTFTANASTDVTCNITIPTKTSDLTNDSGFLTSHQDLSGYVPRSGGAVISGESIGKTNNTSRIMLCGGTDVNNGGSVTIYGKDSSTGDVTIQANDGTNMHQLRLNSNGTATWDNKNLAMQEDVVPRSGGAVMTGSSLGRSINNSHMVICGGTAWNDGASLAVNSKRSSNAGMTEIYLSDTSTNKSMKLYPSGTWTWNGTAVQITSDQRFKQQISEIDDKLLDAWEDVNLVQFKYNDAVEEKGDNARLHTGYVVQQIDEACKSHNVDISAYGLFCHEEYAEETEEVEVEQADGTKTKEKKVIREASEHYSLRYTETLVVECAYLRRENNRLKERLSKIENLLNI